LSTTRSRLPLAYVYHPSSSLPLESARRAALSLGTDGKRLWRHIPDGFELNLGSSHQSQTHSHCKRHASGAVLINSQLEIRQIRIAKASQKCQKQLDTASMSNPSHCRHEADTNASSAYIFHTSSNIVNSTLSPPMEQGRSMTSSYLSTSGQSGKRPQALTPSQATSTRRPTSRLNTDSDSASEVCDAKRSNTHTGMHADTESRASSRGLKPALDLRIT
jgi:hypothetical protein